MKRRISTKITFLVFGSVMTVALFVGVYMDRGSSSILLDQLEDHQRTDVEMRAQRLLRPVEVLKEDLLFLSKVVKPEKGDVEIEEILRKFLGEKSVYHRAWVHRIEGSSVLALGLERFGTELRAFPSASDARVSFPLNLGGHPGEIFFSEISFGGGVHSLSQETYLTAKTPLFSGEHQIGELVLTLDLKKDLSEFVIETAKEFEPFVVDEKGHLVAFDFSSPRFKTMSKSPNVREIFPEIEEKLSSFHREKSIVLPVHSEVGSNTKNIYFHKVHYDPLHAERFLGVGVVVDSRRALLASQHLRNESLMVVIGLAILCAVGAVTLANQITTPLSEITRAVEGFGTGANEVSLPTHYRDEIGTLARSFQKMVEQVHQRNLALIQSEEKFRVIFETAQDGVITIGIDRKVKSFNVAAEKLFGYTKDEVVGKDVGILMGAELKRVYVSYLEKYFSEKPDREQQGTISNAMGRHRDGTEIPVILSISLIQLGHETLLAGIVRDVSEMKKIENSLKKSEAQLRLFVKHTPAAIAMFDSNVRYLVASDRWIRDYNLENVDFIGKSHYDIFPETPERWKEIHSSCLEGYSEVCKEDKFESSEGTIEWIKWEVHPWYLETNVIGGIIMFTEVITDRKKAELELHFLHTQLIESSRKAGMAEVANGVLHNVGNVLNSANVTIHLLPEKIHHLRIQRLKESSDLLKSQSNLAEFLTQDERGKNFGDYFSYVTEVMVKTESEILSEVSSLRKNIEHMSNIVDLQQTYAGRSSAQELMSINEIVEDSIRMSSGSLGKWGIDIIREFESIEPSMVDKHKIVQILVNLIQNSKEALKESGNSNKEIRIRTGRFKDRIRIEVIDNGIGISDENQSRIFQFGFTTKPEGHGFGLHNCLLSAQEMGGHLSCVTHGLGQGATFALEVPYASNLAVVA